eukprot:TRINITY_DN28079_c0_g1_i3.p2 TRINITY_DN28079_c0_g1~~TRINITY_DN28079_c0_g1_i3.p2  ORF type:complete len:468 (+),score=20.44 TRINITY_DN28079_c0_g1_i3:39-1406(+)
MTVVPKILKQPLQVKFGWFGLECSLNTLQRIESKLLPKPRIDKLKLLHLFYSFGVITVIFLSFSLPFYAAHKLLFFASNSVFQQRQTNDEVDELSDQFNLNIQLIIPGITVPLIHAVYGMIACMIAMVVHEWGHVTAAMVARVQVIKIRFNLYGFIFPIASTDLDTEAFNSIGRWKRLQVITAGVYHNIILCLLCILLLPNLPQLLSPFYQTDAGLRVQQVRQNHALYTLINRGDVLTSINGILINNIDQWKIQINNLKTNSGYCIDQNYALERQSWREDCSADMPCSLSSDVCFEQWIGENYVQSKCYKGIEIVDRMQGQCQLQGCGVGMVCLRPQLGVGVGVGVEQEKQYEEMLFIPLQLRSRLHEQDYNVVYVGPKSELIDGLKLSGYIARNIYLPMDAPLVIETTLWYVVGLSAELGLLNILPLCYLDGGMLWLELYQGLREWLKSKQRKK